MAVISELLQDRSRPVRTVVSLAALGAVVYAAVVTDPGLGLHGRQLVALICTVLGGLGWLARTAAGFADPEPRRVAAPTVVLVLAGSLLVGVEPASVGLVFAGVGVFTAALVFSPAAGLTLTACGVVTLAAGMAAYGHDWVSFGGYAAGMAAILLGGFNRRQRRERLAAAEQAQEDRAKAAALDERARIAREIHDVLAHSLGALSVQLEAADALLVDASAPERAHEHVARARRWPPAASPRPGARSGRCAGTRRRWRSSFGGSPRSTAPTPAPPPRSRWASSPSSRPTRRWPPTAPPRRR